MISENPAVKLEDGTKVCRHTVEVLCPNCSRDVVARIRELKQELSKKYEVSFEGHVKKLAEIRDAAMTGGNFAAAVAAEKSRGQAAGIYIDRKEILHGKIDQMSRDEVMREIKRIQEEFPALAVVAEGNMVLEHEDNKGD